MSFQYLIYSVQFHLFSIFYNLFKYPKIKDFNWIKDIPSEVLWKRVNYEKKMNLSKKSENLLLNWESLIMLISDNYLENIFFLKDKKLVFKGFINQIVNKNDEEEKKILNESFRKKIPHEVYKIRIKTNVGKDYESKIFRGEASKVGSYSSIEKNVLKLIENVRHNGLHIDHIQIDHTHLSLEILSLVENKMTYYFNGLSEADIIIAKELKHKTDYPITIKAINPSGWSYSYSI